MVTSPRFGRARRGAASWIVAATLVASLAHAEPRTEASAARTADGADDSGSLKAPPAPEPRVHHPPVSVAESGTPLVIRASIDHPELVKRASLVYRTADKPEHRDVSVQRGSDGPYVAIVPAEEVKNPWLAYNIELEQVDGARIAAFASRAAMQVVEVPEQLDDMRERAADERLQGRRSVVTSSLEYVRFGARFADASKMSSIGGAPAAPLRLTEEYYRVEAGYTYRLLRTLAEFSLRGGVVRTTDSKTVGLNYGAPSVRLRLGDIWHLEGEFLTSVTDQGFSVGAGGALLIGDPYGSKLTVGFETIEDFGSRFYSRMDIAASRRLLVAPIVEATNMPYGDRFGVRLLANVRYDLGSGIFVGVTGGYQARVSTSGGPSLGGTLQYAF